MSIAEIRAKIKRANEHIRNLEQETKSFLGTNPYSVGLDENAQPGDYYGIAHIREAVPPCIALIAGDAIHNLRAALDHLACELVRANGRKPGDKIYFPIGWSKRDFAKRCKGEIRQAGAKAMCILRKIKPYKGGNTDLWRLERLDIIDKHRALVLTSAGAWHGTIETSGERGTIGMAMSIMRSRGLLRLVDGASIGGFSRPDVPQTNVKFNFAFDVAIDEVGIVECEGLLDVLAGLSRIAERVVDEFVPLLPP